MRHAIASDGEQKQAANRTTDRTGVEERPSSDRPTTIASAIARARGTAGALGMGRAVISPNAGAALLSVGCPEEAAADGCPDAGPGAPAGGRGACRARGPPH